MNISEIVIPHLDTEQVVSAAISPRLRFLAVVLKNTPGAVIYDCKAEYLKARVKVPPREMLGSSDQPVLSGRMVVPSVHQVCDLSFRPQLAKQTTELALAVGENAEQVERLDIDMQTRLIGVFMPRAQRVAYSHDGKYVAAGNSSGTVTVWRLEDTPMEVCSRHLDKNNSVIGLAFGPGGDSLYVVLSSGDVWVFNPLQAKSHLTPAVRDRDLRRWKGSYYCVATQNRLREIALGGQGNRVLVHNPITYSIREITTGLHVHEFVRSLQFIGDNQLLVIGSRGRLEVWHVPADDEMVRLASHQNVSDKRIICARYYAGVLIAASA